MKQIIIVIIVCVFLSSCSQTSVVSEKEHLERLKRKHMQVLK